MPTGWNDPAWSTGPYAAFFPTRFPTIEAAQRQAAQQQAAQQQAAQQQAAPSYLDRIQQAAATGAPMPNLAQLPGFQPNLSPAPATDARADHA